MVAAELQGECADLAQECADTLNATPAGRLQLVCAGQNLPLQPEQAEALLAEHRLLNALLRKPLPMKPAMLEKCVALLTEILSSADAAGPADLSAQEADVASLPIVSVAPLAPQSLTVEAKAPDTESAALDAQIEAAETRVAEKENTLATVKSERDATETKEEIVLDDIDEAFAAMPQGTIGEYRQRIVQHISQQPNLTGEQRAVQQRQAFEILERYADQLHGLQAVFTLQEVQQVFGGSVVESVRLNLAASNNADIYRDVFARIDASLVDDSRRRELRAAVAQKLGVQFHDDDPPGKASELQDRLAKGRGAEKITETRQVEEPPGSGNFIEKEVVVGEKTLEFTERDRLVISPSNPRVTAFPDPAGSQTYRFIGEVAGGPPLSLWRDIPNAGSFPTADINNDMNVMLLDAQFRNRGLAGGIQALFGQGDSAFGVESAADAHAHGRTDLTQGLLTMFLGENTLLRSRFLTGGELISVGDDIRHIAPDGDFGAFNQMDAHKAASLMHALFGEGQVQILANMERARPFINTGGAEAPSFQRLYAKMYPEDAAAGFPRLRSIVGNDGMARLSLHPDKAQDDRMDEMT